MTTNGLSRPCKRCNAHEAALVVRNEPLCRSCFTIYINTKIIKRMEAFRTRNSAEGHRRKLLLPISFGVSSTCLLDVLSRHIKQQQDRNGRPGYSLILLHVTGASLSTSAGEEDKNIEKLKEAYPQHPYFELDLSSVYDSGRSLDQGSQEEAAFKLQRLLDSASSATSRSDIVSVLLTRAIVKFAIAHECEGILWGDSTTKLAEKILAESAKGRGFSLPWQVTDGETPYGINFYFPVREVLKKELLDFAKMTDSRLVDLISDEAFTPAQAPVSSKNTTIDLLMKQYFESVEESYPSIVSNVVRTSTKLQPSVVGLRRCKLCTHPVTKEQLGIESWEGTQDSEKDPSGDKLELCYGCSRTIPESAIPLLPR
ncbi:hypothetical protein BT63DRAFT_429127 [Microthyrium microscopicum]|uniref:Cytoplasmic tRNA 2-thiolation protein 2 n=1 Tax=Microthyrium microscopicum TaxID=703497 RepID=A0A6A6U242_9PEZI|nr:hypothetical protein BT63DRAFT_429127 [Microthyrium microscopicum]